MKISAYLGFGGNCKEAFAFYQQVLGGEMPMTMTTGESPVADQFPPDWQDKIMHTRLVIGESVLMGSDAPPPYFTAPQGFNVSIVLDNVAEGKRVFDALSEGGTVKMPFEKTFWSEGFGMLQDKFGIPWMINCGM